MSDRPGTDARLGPAVPLAHQSARPDRCAHPFALLAVSLGRTCPGARLGAGIGAGLAAGIGVRLDRRGHRVVSSKASTVTPSQEIPTAHAPMIGAWQDGSGFLLAMAAVRS